MASPKSSLLVEMTHSPGEGFESMIGTYWVRQKNGVFRHTTPMQSELKITIPKHYVWTDYFKEVTRADT